ncbi:MAG: phosphatidylserine decarboxylase [Hyphomonas sp.]|uniref:phosphatidylserine decarboxylase n=1 Tax=Hyphomonas sp. TaxID=87 RepID=UPI0034A06CB6
MSDEIERRSMPWLNVVLDWEGVAAAAAAFLAALLLGWIWGPLFWIGFAAMLAALAAGRWSRRSPPDLADGVVAPCDGIVLSIERDEPPTALRLSAGSVVRIRIASSPFVTNKLYTPIAGGVDLISLAQGETNAPLAFRPDDDGLTRAYITFESAGEQAGVALASGGLGPRIDLAVETGDVVRLGRAFGTRRLGGWCDLYLPASMSVQVWPGQTLVGGETVIGRLRAGFDDDRVIDVVEAVVAEARRAPLAAAPVVSADMIAEEEEIFDDYPEPDEVEAPEDPAAIFARLREAARKHGESD